MNSESLVQNSCRSFHYVCALSSRRRAADRLDGHDPGGRGRWGGRAGAADGLAGRGHAHPGAAGRDAAAHDAPGRGDHARAHAGLQDQVARGVRVPDCCICAHFLMIICVLLSKASYLNSCSESQATSNSYSHLFVRV